MQKITRTSSLLLVLALPLTVTIPGLSQSTHIAKKVISFSGNPTARMFHDDVQEMERLMPVVDGVTIYPTTDKNGLRTEAIGRLFRTDFHRLADFDTGIDLMRSAAPNLFRENFLLVYLTSGVVGLEVPNWFDPEFDAVINNWKVAAEYARRAGMTGLLFDNEVYYGKNLWDYERIDHLDPRPAEEYYDQAFLRGAQIMRAVNTVYPDIKILVLIGPLHAKISSSGHDPTRPFELMRAFFDGLLSECTGEAAIIEGAEKAYKFRQASAFEKEANSFKTEVRARSRVPEAFDRHARIAFPIYLGGGSNYPDPTHFSIDDFSTNYYSPEELATALRGALEHAAEYVWIYTEHVSLWKRDHMKFLPQEYRDAMLSVHDPALALPTAVEEDPPPTLPRQHALQQNFPNPFNGDTHIQFNLPLQSEVFLGIFNLAGHRISTLIQDRREAGTHNLQWDGRDNSGKDVASGGYVYRLQTPHVAMTRKLMILR